METTCPRVGGAVTPTCGPRELPRRASAPDPHPARPLPQLSGQSAQLFPVSAVAAWPEMKQETSFLLPAKSRTQGERGRPGRGLSRTRSTEGGVQTQRASRASPAPPSRGLPEVPPRQAEQWAKGQRGPWGGARRRPGPGRQWPPESRRFLPAGAGPALTDWPPQPSLSPAAGLGQELLGSCRLGSGPGCSAGWAALPPTPPLNCLAAESPGRSSARRGRLSRWNCNLPGSCLQLSRHRSPPGLGCGRYLSPQPWGPQSHVAITWGPEQTPSPASF